MHMKAWETTFFCVLSIKEWLAWFTVDNFCKIEYSSKQGSLVLSLQLPLIGIKAFYNILEYLKALQSLFKSMYYMSIDV